MAEEVLDASYELTHDFDKHYDAVVGCKKPSERNYMTLLYTV